MTPDLLEKLLRETPTPDASGARERAVAEARAQVAGRSAVPRAPRPALRALVGLGAAALLVAVVLLTPPGRAASAWVGDLVGIGDVGGSPTQDDRGLDTSEAVVIDNGQAPDGSRYEWVAYRCEVDMREQGMRGSFKGIGVSLEWPGSQGPGGGGSCAETAGAPPEEHSFSSHGVHILPSQFKGVARPDLVVAGSTGADVHRVRILYTDRFGEKHELPIDFARVEGKLRELAHQPEPLGTFTAFIPGEWAARDELESRLDLRAVYGTGELVLGPLGRRERAEARQAFEICERHEDERAFALLRRCMEEHLPPSPIEYVAYDDEGRELERITEPLIAYVRPRPSADEVAGREQPGDRRGRPPVGPGETAVALMSGRAPEGALYEVYATFFKGDGAPSAQCVGVWWPYVPEARNGGSCGTGVPPDTAFERAAAKPHGYLSDLGAEATAHWLLSGYARPAVSRVRVRYRDRQGSWHDAPVDLGHVKGALVARARADAPFGFFVAFVPRRVDRCQGGRAERCMAIEVIAYGPEGRELSRVKHRSD